MRWSYDPNVGLVRVGDMKIPQRYEIRTDAEDGEPSLRMVFEVRNGVPECRGIYVESWEDGRGLRTSDVRSISVDDYVAAATASLALHIVDDDGREVLMSSAPQDVRNAWRQVERVRVKAGPRRAHNVDLGDVAEVYATAEHAPTKTVAEHFEMPHRTASLYVKRARDAGLLPPLGRSEG